MTDLLECAGLSRSTYYAARKRDRRQTRRELWDWVREIFSRTANGCGHRQIAMCLRAEHGVTIADKTVLKIMRELELHCGIRRESKYHRYNSYQGETGVIAVNVLQRDFHASGPWQKLGTDVTEFKQDWGKAYLAPVCDMWNNEIIAWQVSQSPCLMQQTSLLKDLFARMPAGVSPILHSDRGWQYQHEAWRHALAEHGVQQSMSRKGNCLDNAATEQWFGHMKDEFFTGQSWPSFTTFKTALDEYIEYWNTRRRQTRLGGLTPVEYREQHQ